MGFRNISAWAIRNPVPPIVLFIMLSIAGAISFARMDINEQPDIDFPAVLIQITQPGAAPSELETQVTQRVEAAVRNLEGVDEIQSTVSEGSSVTFVQMAIGTPIDRAVNEARDAVTQIRANLPEGILEPQVQRVVINQNDLGSFTALATDMTLEQLSWYIDNTVAKELLSIPGMGQVTRSGGVSREIRVILDPQRLASQGLTATQINQALRQVNLNAAGGRAEIAGAEQSVRVLGNAATAYELGQTQINVGGRTVRLADVADVRDLYAEQRTTAAVNGSPAVSFTFRRAKGASDVTVFREAQAKLTALEKRNPQVRFQLRVDNSRYPLEQYKTAIHAMIEGAILAVVVVFLFLRDWRATVISALAIPLSAIPAFVFMDMLGFTLNNMTMMALSLVAGVLVDDAIVEIENIVRHMRMGKTAYQASIDAADEIGLAVLATTMAIVAVFLPVGLMPGISGQFFKNFGLTVVVSVLMSLAVARLITPMIAAYFLKSSGHAEHAGGPAMALYGRILAWTLNEGKSPAIRARGGFRRATGYLRDHRVWTMAMGGFAFLLTIFLATQISITFQPTRDLPRSAVDITMPPGTTLAQTQTVVDEVTRLLRPQPEVESVFSRTSVGSAVVVARLLPERKRSSIEFERALAPKLAAIPDARVNFQTQNNFGNGESRDVNLTLGGDDPVVLRAAAERVVAQMRAQPGLVAPRISGALNRPEILIRPRLDLAANLGVTTAALSSAIRVATIGDIDQNSARFSLNDRQIPIRVALEENARSRLDTIQNLPVQTQTGGSVPLGLVAQIGFGSGPTQIERINQQRQLTLGADLAAGVVSGDALSAIRKLPAMSDLPVGVAELDTGPNKWQQEMLVNFIFAVFAGVFLVFAVLVLLYGRLLPPLVNLGSLLLAPLGGLIALMIAGYPLSMPVFIGLLMLLGIVAKNSILLIDFALDEMKSGIAPRAAIVEAGFKRAQPIVMTTVAMIAGMVPTALSLSGDSSSRAPMGVTVIGGLALSTLLTLLIVPASFSLAVGIERRVGPWLGRRLLSYRPGDEDAPAIEHDAPKGSIAAPVGRIGFRGPGDAPAE